MIELAKEKVWEKFCEFFRLEKGYSDWTDQQIDYSRNDDDIEKFIEWLVEELDKVNNLWKDAEGDYLPLIDKEVIALEGLDEESNYRVIFAHRVDPDRVIRTTIDNKPLELHSSKYGKAGWNLPNLKYWLDLELPKKE